MAYVLDTNVFISAKNLHYGFDFCPAFWEWIIHKNKVGEVFSIEKVGDELQALEDDLSEWAAARGPQLFVPPDSSVVPELARVSQWVQGQNYKPAATNLFLQGADLYLIAQALARRHVVVTHEKPANSRNIVKIPNVCIALGVKCMNPFEMLRTERARFALVK